MDDRYGINLTLGMRRGLPLWLWPSNDCPPFSVVYFKCVVPNYYHFLTNFRLSLVPGVCTHVSTVLNSPTSSCGDKLTAVKAGCHQLTPSGSSFSSGFTPQSDGFLPFSFFPSFFSSISTALPLWIGQWAKKVD